MNGNRASALGPARLSRDFSALVRAGHPPDDSVSRVGIEHEFTVWRGDERVDFRRLVHDLELEGRRLDPGDPNAYRCAWGGVVTADGREAEIAIPPVRRAQGFATVADGCAVTGRRALEAALPAGTTVDGYSTHISVAVAGRDTDRVARTYAATFAPALMLLMEKRTSPGLLVRPRPGRVELCGEFATGAPLRAATAFAVGSVAATVSALHAGRRAGAGMLPPRLDVDVQRAVGRYGWYVDRRAFGTDLYDGGRGSVLKVVRGPAISAQAHLQRARDLVAAHVDDAGAGAGELDAFVSGALALPSETATQGGDESSAITPTAEWRAVVARHDRPRFAVQAVVALWHTTVFEVRDGARAAYANVPTAQLPAFLERLASGHLDGVLVDYLRAPTSGRVLDAVGDTSRPGLYDRVGGGTGLLLPERDSAGQRLSGPGGPGSSSRHGKRAGDQSAPRPRIPMRWLVGAGALLAAIVVAIFAVGASGGGGASSKPHRATAGAVAGPSTSSVPRGAPSTLAVVSGGASGTVVAMQDGIFTTSLGYTLDRQSVRAGDTVTMHLDARSDGPNYARNVDPAGNPLGPWHVECTAVERKNITTNAGIQPIGVAPADASRPDMMLAISNGDIPDVLQIVNGNLTVVEPITIETNGCNATWTFRADYTFPASLAPGRYRLFVDEFLNRNWADPTPGALTVTSGDFPIVTVT